MDNSDNQAMLQIPLSFMFELKKGIKDSTAIITKVKDQLAVDEQDEAHWVYARTLIDDLKDNIVHLQYLINRL